MDRIHTQLASGLRVGLISTIISKKRFDDVAGDLLSQYQVAYSTYPHRSIFRNILSGVMEIRRFNKAHPSGGIYVRGIWGGLVHLLAFPLSGPDLIYDFRGDVVAEAEARGRRGLRLMLLKFITGLVIRRAKLVLCISRPAADLLSKNYGRKDAFVIPSAVDEKRFTDSRSQRTRIRRSLGFSEKDLVLVYSGGLARHQMLPELLKLWSSLQDMEGLHYLLLLNQRPEPGQLPDLDDLISTGRVTIKNLRREEVPVYLAAADVGFLIREIHPLNAVASPVKFAEYLASGLAVVTSPCLGEVSRLVKDRRLGILVNTDNALECSEKCRGYLESFADDRDNVVRRSQQTIAEEKMAWKDHVDLWKELFPDDKR